MRGCSSADTERLATNQKAVSSNLTSPSIIFLHLFALYARMFLATLIAKVL